MRKLLSLLAAIFMAVSMWAVDFSGGATFNFKYATDVYAGAKYVKGTAEPADMTSNGSGTSIYWYAAASSTFTLVDSEGAAMFDGLKFTSGSTAGSTRFYYNYGFYCGQNASKITIDGSTLVEGQQITIDYNVTGNTNDSIKVTNLTGTIASTTGKNVTQTSTLTVTADATDVTIGRNSQTVEITRIVISAAPTNPIISANSSIEIASNITSGEIAYSITNPVVGVTPTATLTSGDWVSNVQVDAANGKVTFSATENAIREERTATIKISYTGAADKIITITQGKAPLAEIVDVTGAMTWNFTGYANSVTTPNKNEEVILGDYVTLTTGDADALKGKQEYIVRSGYCWQGTDLIFHPTVAGVVRVLWSSTSGTNHRTLKINNREYEVPEGVTSTGASGATTSTVFVPANEDVVLTGWNFNSENGEYTSNQIRIWEMSFTPAEQVTISAAGWATFFTDHAVVVPTGIEGYTVTAAGESITLSKAYEADDVVPANTPLLLKGAAETYTFLYSEEAGTAAGTNYLHGNLNNGAIATVAGATKYFKLANGANGLGWYYGANDGGVFTLGAHKAYLALDDEKAAHISAHFFDTEEVTAVENVETVETVKFMENGQLFIKKNGVIYNAMGQVVK